MIAKEPLIGTMPKTVKASSEYCDKLPLRAGSSGGLRGSALRVDGTLLKNSLKAPHTGSLSHEPMYYQYREWYEEILSSLSCLRQDR